MIKTVTSPEIYFFDTDKSMQLYIQEYDPATTADISLAISTTLGVTVTVTAAAVKELVSNTQLRFFLVAHVFNYDYQYFMGSTPLASPSFENNLVKLAAYGSTTIDGLGTVTRITNTFTNASSLVKFTYTLGSNIDYKLFDC